MERSRPALAGCTSGGVASGGPDSGDYAGGDPASTTIRSHTMTYSRTARHSSGAILTCDR